MNTARISKSIASVFEFFMLLFCCFVGQIYVANLIQQK
jgi:hypothetical protein